MKASFTLRNVLCALFLLLMIPIPARGDIIAPEQVDAFAYQMGIEPDMDSFQQHEAFSETSFGGIVIEPCKMAALGFKTAKEGERVEVICRDDGQWLGRVLSTGEERIFKVSVGWGKKD